MITHIMNYLRASTIQNRIEKFGSSRFAAFLTSLLHNTFPKWPHLHKQNFFLKITTKSDFFSLANILGSENVLMIGNKCYNYPQASNQNRKQVEESTCWFLLLIDKQLTNTCNWYVSQCISPPLRGIIVYGISEEKRTKCKSITSPS